MAATLNAFGFKVPGSLREKAISQVALIGIGQEGYPIEVQCCPPERAETRAEEWLRGTVHIKEVIISKRFSIEGSKSLK